MKAEVGADSIMHTADYPPARKALLINRVAMASRAFIVSTGNKLSFSPFNPVGLICLYGYETASRLPLSPSALPPEHNTGANYQECIINFAQAVGFATISPS